MKPFGFTFTMDYGGGVLSLLLGVFCLSQVIDARSHFQVPCPPAFPDFEAIFARTLRFNQKLRSQKFHLQAQFNRPPNCSCSPELMSRIADVNSRRCNSRTSSYIRPQCPTTSTARVTSPTTRLPQPVSSLRPLPPSPTTIGYSTGGGGRWTFPTQPTLDKHRSSSSSGGVNVIDLDRTTPVGGKTEPGLPEGPTPKPVTTRDDSFTIIVIAIGAGVLLLIFLIGCLLLCRKRLCVGSGVRGALRKQEKVRRLRSDCQPISAISRADTFEDSYAPSMISSVGSVGSEGFRRSYVTNGRKWRPDFDSETGSEKSTADSKYILLREDSSASALSFSNHYNTLRTIDHPHALMMGGFGESSTDNMTIPRTSKKNKRFHHANGDISLDSIEDPLEVMPHSSTLRRERSKDSINTIEIYDRVASSNARARYLAHLNGYANGHGPPQPSSTRAQQQPEDEADSASLGTIDHADEGLQGEPVAMATPNLRQPVQLQQQQQARQSKREPEISVKSGIINISFQADDEPAADKPDPNWQNDVLSELKRESARNPDTKPAVADSFDSLKSAKNSHLFGYDNKTLVDSTLSADSQVSHLDPPSDFRDSKDSEISVAVVQPLKHDNPLSRNFSKRRGEPRPHLLQQQASTSSSPTKKEPPPVAKKPQSNGSIISNGSLSRQASTDPLITNGAVNRKDKLSTVPVVNGAVSNGHVNHVLNGLHSDEEDELGKVKRMIQQRESVLKPSAHVQPTRYGDTRL